MSFLIIDNLTFSKTCEKHKALGLKKSSAIYTGCATCIHRDIYHRDTHRVFVWVGPLAFCRRKN
jgi:hypothetical protein